MFVRILPIVVLSLLTCACAGKTPEVASMPVVPLTSGPIDPPDEVMAQAIKGYLKESGAPAFSHYEFSRMDLDNDGRRDALVLFKNPYGYWCDVNGCAMLVLKAHDTGFDMVNAMQPVRGPLLVSEDHTNGWKNIIVRVSGRPDTSKDVAMQFDGSRYPENPADQPAFDIASVDGLRIFP